MDAGPVPFGPQEYGRYQQHAGLINDPLRVATYNYAISRSPPGRLILDVGAGSGILSLLALKHGYEHAFLVEPSKKIANYASYLLDKNGFEGRYTILLSAFEDLTIEQLPLAKDVDLLVTETISSLGVGFGCWPKLLTYAKKMRSSAIKIPHSVVVNIGLAPIDYSHSQTGIQLLTEIGLEIDLAARTFWSGGNISNKKQFNEALRSSSIILKPTIELTLGQTPAIEFEPVKFNQHLWTNACGVVAFFQAHLIENDDRSILSSNDENLHSWTPFYSPISFPVNKEHTLDRELIIKMLSGDTPFPYYFQFHCDNDALTHPLLW